MKRNLPQQMNGIMNENQLTVVKEVEFEKPFIHKIDSIINNCIRDCNKKYFHTFDHICVYIIKITNIGDNEKLHLTISGKA